MNTPWTCSGQLKEVAAAPRGDRRIPKNAVSGGVHRVFQQAYRPAIVALGVLALLAGGCGYAGGELLYMLGFGRPAKVEARFRLTEEPILILVDDPAQRIDWPIAKRYLTDELAQELIKKKAAKKIIPRQTLDRLRQSEPNLDKRGCREVGRMAGAEQVLWIETQDFYAREQIDAVDEAAYIAVTVKVLNAGEMPPGSRPRLWPTSPRGQEVLATLAGSEVLMLKTRDAIARELAGRLATRIAKLFYDHRLKETASGK